LVPCYHSQVNFKKIIQIDWGLIIDGKDQVISPITLGLLEDSGFYKVNYSNAEFLSWGRKFGCDMFNKRCENWKNENYFCSNPQEESCSSDYFQKSSCKIARYSEDLKFNQHLKEPNLGGISALNYCPFYFPKTNEYSNCKLKSNLNLTSVRSGQQFGDHSMCFKSSLIEEFKLNPSNLRCFHVNCTKYDQNEFKMFVSIEDVIFECPSLQSIEPKVKGFLGSIQCPNVNLACEIQSSKVNYSLSEPKYFSKISSQSSKSEFAIFSTMVFLFLFFN
jgi:leishmanolysin